MKPHRKGAGFVILVGLAAVGLGAAGGPEPPASPAALVNVSKMLDGDSLVATTGRETVEMRLYDIDAPEYDTPEGQRAGQLATRLVSGRRVWVFPSGKRRHDAHGRLLVRIWLPQSGWLSDRLLGVGLARRYVDPDNPSRGTVAPRGRPAAQPSEPPASKPVDAPKPADTPRADEPIVFISPTGTKYHTRDCRYTTATSTPIPLSAAKAQGYDPCKVCHPPE